MAKRPLPPWPDTAASCVSRTRPLAPLLPAAPLPLAMLLLAPLRDAALIVLLLLLLAAAPPPVRSEPASERAEGS